MRGDEFITDLTNRVQRRLAQQPQESHRIAEIIREEAGLVISDVDVLTVLRKLRHDSVGIGPLEKILALPGITDIVVNRPDSVWFDRGAGLERSAIEFADDNEVRRLATRLLAASGQRIDDAQCFADGRFTREDGVILRVHAILSPPSQSGTCLSLRVLGNTSATVDDLRQRGALNETSEKLVRELVGERKPLIVVGGTGTGKTTLLSALLGLVPHSHRILCIEDTQELNPAHPHVLSLTTRNANAEGVGEVSMSDLLKQSLRMRPDRIILGEIRGREVVDLLAALNTGHEGCAGTLHANDIYDVPARLEALAAVGGMSRDALAAQLAAAEPVILGMRRDEHGRRLAHIGQLRGNPVDIHMLWEES